jgi:hypothetical protein
MVVGRDAGQRHQRPSGGAQVLVLLSHMEHEDDTLRVVRAVPGVDVALGTHHWTRSPPT